MLSPGLGIHDHKLCGILQTPSPNVGGYISPTLIVIHYTGGSSAKSAVNTFLRKASKVSAHVVIGARGSITQMVPFNRRAWHAGKSSWKGRPSCNGFAVGIELVNPGWLASDGIRARHKSGGPIRTWGLYPDVQVRSCADVCRSLLTYYHIQDIVGHDDVSPGRKTDPGPAWDWPSFLERVGPALLG